MFIIIYTIYFVGGLSMRKAHVILKSGKSVDVEFEGGLIDCMNLCKKKFGYYPFLDSVYHINK